MIKTTNKQNEDLAIFGLDVSTFDGNLENLLDELTFMLMRIGMDDEQNNLTDVGRALRDLHDDIYYQNKYGELNV